MIGNNEMILNEATMIQAVQEWLDKRMPNSHTKVTSVSKSDYVEFKIVLQSDIPAPPVQS
jgi:hypothetical protein